MVDSKNKLKIISFDVDGTLVDLEYNDLIWFKEIPELVAKKKKVSFEKSLKYVSEEYIKLGEHNLNWYDINYWITYFKLEVSPKKILEKYESQVKIFPEVIPLLEELKKNFILIVITAMPREFLIPKMKKLEKYFKFCFSALSDFKELKNSEIYLKISKTLNVCPEQILHIGDHWEFDYLAAQKAGMNAIYLDRSNIKKGNFVVNNLTEIKRVIRDKYNN
ncbi:MAG: HAD family hydrolase [Candidatus Atribacteria bacterium]|nr:HAD family hydrolase [Candidatus Atribacteria bacterium]MCG2821531.1 HAD family hydrolase [Candidatus Atribacteria bacterium]